MRQVFFTQDTDLMGHVKKVDKDYYEIDYD